jgi:hypothetical protein
MPMLICTNLCPHPLLQFTTHPERTLRAFPLYHQHKHVHLCYSLGRNYLRMSVIYLEPPSLEIYRLCQTHGHSWASCIAHHRLWGGEGVKLGKITVNPVIPDPAILVLTPKLQPAYPTPPALTQAAANMQSSVEQERSNCSKAFS